MLASVPLWFLAAGLVVPHARVLPRSSVIRVAPPPHSALRLSSPVMTVALQANSIPGVPPALPTATSNKFLNVLSGVWFAITSLIVLILSYIPLLPCVAYSIIFDRQQRRSVDFCVKLWARGSLFMLGSQVKVIGVENLPPPGEAVLFCPNHCSFLDIFVLSAYLPRYVRKTPLEPYPHPSLTRASPEPQALPEPESLPGLFPLSIAPSRALACTYLAKPSSSIATPGRRQVKYISKIEILRIPLIGWAMQFARHIPLRRSDRKSQMETFREAVASLQAGNNLIAFPEGTRSKVHYIVHYIVHFIMHYHLIAFPEGTRPKVRLSPCTSNLTLTLAPTLAQHPPPPTPHTRTPPPPSPHPRPHLRPHLGP